MTVTVAALSLVGMALRVLLALPIRVAAWACWVIGFGMARVAHGLALGADAVEGRRP